MVAGQIPVLHAMVAGQAPCNCMLWQIRLLFPPPVTACYGGVTCMQHIACSCRMHDLHYSIDLDVISSPLFNQDGWLGQGQLWWCTWQCDMMWFNNVIIEIKFTFHSAKYWTKVKSGTTNPWSAVSILWGCYAFGVTGIILGSYWITQSS